MTTDKFGFSFALALAMSSLIWGICWIVGAHPDATDFMLMFLGGMVGSLLAWRTP